MSLLIFEYFAAGAQQGVFSLQKTGFGILNAVLADFAKLPNIKLATILDQTLAPMAASIRDIKNIQIYWQRTKGEPLHCFQEVLAGYDQVLIIAPETDGVLARYTALAEALGKQVLGSSFQAIKLSSNKGGLMDLWQEKGLPVPNSQVITPFFIQSLKKSIYQDFVLPLVAKPLQGTGGAGVRLIRTSKELQNVFNLLAESKGKKNRGILLQEFVQGQDASASCLVLDGEVLPLSLNRQIIDKGEEFVFRGLTVPYSLHEQTQIWRIIQAACQAISGLKGFVGVDFVVTSAGPVLIELNPRITAAYIALRETMNRNLAADLWQLFINGSLPEKSELKQAYTYYVDEI